MRSGNPALNVNAFTQSGSAYGQGQMTLQGTINKTFIMLFLVFLTAGWVWGQVDTTPVGYEGATRSIPPFVGMAMGVGAIGGFITAMVSIFKKNWCAVTAPIYALFEGAFLGGITAMFEMSYPGIAMQAVMLTFGVLGAMLMLYKSGLITINHKFRMGLLAATGGICLVYFVSFVMGFFGASIPIIHSASPLGIGFSLLVCGIAAFNLLLDFDLIERGSQMGAPKYMEWYGAFALMVTLIWLYVEILRLLAKFQRR